MDTDRPSHLSMKYQLKRSQGQALKPRKLCDNDELYTTSTQHCEHTYNLTRSQHRFGF
jgi:hypothetical protein